MAADGGGPAGSRANWRAARWMASAISGRPAAAARRGSPDAVRLLAPFDPIVWERRRFEHLWGWDYRFEAYTRPEQRRFGYYAMPLLWGYDVIGWANVSLAGRTAGCRDWLCRRATEGSGIPARPGRRVGGDGEFPGKARRGRPQARDSAPRIGYLLPTREQIMEGRPDAASAAGRWRRAPRRWATIRSGSAIRCWRGRGTIR